MSADKNWVRYNPRQVDRALGNDSGTMSIYIRHQCAHYEVVSSTLELTNNTETNLKKPTDTEPKIITQPKTDKAHKAGSSSIQLTNTPFKFYCVNEQWQDSACATLGIPFARSNKMVPGSLDTVLNTPAKGHKMKKIRGDGNCLFRSFAYMASGSEVHHSYVRAVILEHMKSISHFLIGPHIAFNSVQEYMKWTKMEAMGQT